MTARPAGLLAAALVLALGLRAAPAPATEVAALFPSDRLTVADPAQLTGRRVALPLPSCAADPSGCDEVRLLNQLDGFSVHPRVALRFSAPITLDSVTRDSAFILPLWTEPLPSPVGLGQFVWDSESRTLYARPERALLQSRRYALVVTSRVVDEDNRPLRADPAQITPREAAADGASVEQQLWTALAGAGVKRREVVALTLFTTQSVTADLQRIRAVVEARPPSELRFTLEPGGGRSVYARAEIQALEWQRQTAVTGPLGAPARLPLALVPASEIRAIAFGSYRSPSFLSPDRHIPSTPTRDGAPRPSGEEEIHVTLYLPRGEMPVAGWPVAIFGHGFTNDRHLVPMAVAATMARNGFATVAINVVGHGGGAAGTLTVKRAGGAVVTLPAGGRGLDLDGDGKIEPSEGVSTRSPGPLAAISNRDGLRQTVADLMTLVRALRRGVDVDGDGRSDLDPQRAFYFGHSFGGIYGTLLMAVEPALRVGVLGVPGGPIVEIARQAAVFRPRVAAALQSRNPALMNGARDFYEFIPLFGEPPVRSPLPGALDIQAYFARVEWLSQSADPVAFAPYLRHVPLPGLSPKAVFYQWAVGDLTVPNPTTENILRAGDLHLQSSVYRHDKVMAALPPRFRNPHGFLLWTLFPEVSAIGRAAQEQVARFFLSGGRQIERVDDRFEVQLTRPLAR
ncbi:MAG: hypothetical protein HYV93_26350 [Candidatus Rokubacteria bacterium]|nr:hypothetical protein [Candidatus Rokubacteria bacterium]